MSGSTHVALVGCGFTGTSAFFQLVDRHAANEITIFEATGDFGPGYAYRTDECSEYLINNTTDTMCLTPTSRRAFYDWLSLHPDVAGEPNPKGHLPRAVFGAFLQDTFASTKRAAEAKGIKVNLVPAEATEIVETASGQVVIGWHSGETVVSAAILSTGRCPDRDDYGAPPEPSTTTYIETHIGSSRMDDIANDATVHILGASLSAYDVINRLYAPETGCSFVRSTNGVLEFQPGPNQRNIVLCSRSGRLKYMQSRGPMRLSRAHFSAHAFNASANGGRLTLQDVKGHIQREAEAHGVNIDWEALDDPYRGCSSTNEVTQRAQQVLEEGIAAANGGKNFLVDLFADAQFEVWDAFADHALSADAERQYRKAVETAALAFAAPCPVPTAEKLLALIRADKLTVIKGVNNTKYLQEKDCYAISHDFGTDYATTLINATGATVRDVRSPQQPALVRRLVADGLLSQYTRGRDSDARGVG